MCAIIKIVNQPAGSKQATLGRDVSWLCQAGTKIQHNLPGRAGPSFFFKSGFGI